MHASHGIEHDWNLLQTCISLLEYIGDICLKLNDLEKRITITAQLKKKELDGGDHNIYYLCSNYRICGKREQNDFNKLIQSSQCISSFENRDGIFSNVYDITKNICEYIHDSMLEAIFNPINQLKAKPEFVENLDLSANDLPDYSFAPQEFITVIGQVSYK